MIATLLSSVLATQIVDAPRRLDRLDNGAIVFAERVQAADRISVQLWISSRGVEETSETHGWRHLLEHFLAARLDPEVESKGMFLTAETSRAAMSFRVEAAPEQLADAVEALRGVWKPIALTPEQIAKEVRVIRHEEATLPAARLFARAAWARFWGDASLDPFGDAAIMEKATPERLEALRRRMLASSNVVVTVAGAVSPDGALNQIRPWIASLPASPPSISPPLPSPSPKTVGIGAFGEALAIQVEGVSEPETLADLAVGLVATQFYSDLRLTYTVSSNPGVVSLFSPSPGGLNRVLELSERQLGFGPALVQRWLAGYSTSPSRLAELRGALLVEGSSLTLESLRRSADRLTLSEIQSAQARWKQAARLEGLR